MSGMKKFARGVKKEIYKDTWDDFKMFINSGMKDDTNTLLKVLFFEDGFFNSVR